MQEFIPAFLFYIIGRKILDYPILGKFVIYRIIRKFTQIDKFEIKIYNELKQFLNNINKKKGVESNGKKCKGFQTLCTC